MRTFFERIRALTKRYPVVSASALVFILLGVGNYFLWRWHQTLSFRHFEIRAETDNMLEKMSTHSRLEEQLKIVQQAADYIDRNLITASDLAGNNEYFYQLETASRVRLSDLNQANAPAPSEGSPFIAVPFSMRATGSYRQVMAFLREIEQGPHVARITSMEFSRETPTGDTLTMSLSVTLLGKP